MNSTHATRSVQQPEWPICSTFFSDDAIALVYTTTTTSDCCCGCLKLQQPAPLKIRKEKKKFDIFRHGINVTRSGHYSVRRWRSTSFLPFLYKRCGLPPLKKKKNGSPNSHVTDPMENVFSQNKSRTGFRLIFSSVLLLRRNELHHVQRSMASSKMENRINQKNLSDDYNLGIVYVRRKNNTTTNTIRRKSRRFVFFRLTSKIISKSNLFLLLFDLIIIRTAKKLMSDSGEEEDLPM